MKSKSRSKRLVTMIDVAKRAKCSQPAVSHALTGSGAGRIRVRPEKIAEIRRIASEMGYKPNLTARQLAGKRSHMIGVVTDTLQTVPHARMFAWIQHFAYKFGLHIMVAQTDNQADRIQQAVDEFNGRGVEGVIYIAYLNDSHWSDASEHLAACHNLISVFGRPPIKSGYHIDIDVAEGARQSVLHLTERGRKNIVLLLDDLEASWSQRRREGFQEAHRQLGLDVKDNQVLVLPEPIDWPHEHVEARIDQLVQNLIDERCVDAIIADDGTAGLLTGAFANRGIRVPQDVALIGHGNEVMVHFTYPRLTTVDIRTRQVMEHTVRTLAALINDDDGDDDDSHVKSEIITPTLLIREST